LLDFWAKQHLLGVGAAVSRLFVATHMPLLINEQRASPVFETTSFKLTNSYKQQNISAQAGLASIAPRTKNKYDKLNHSFRNRLGQISNWILLTSSFTQSLSILFLT